MSTTLPTSDVDVASTSDGSGTAVGITVKRDGKQRTWSGGGATHDAAVKEAVKKMVNDPITGEFLP